MRIIFSQQQKLMLSLESLSNRQISLFLCAICQRQVIVYVEFVEGESWANSTELIDIMNSCWRFSILGEKPDTFIVPEMCNFLDINYNQSSSSFAIDAFSSIWHLTQWLVSHDVSNISPPIENGFNILDGHIYGLLDLKKITRENDGLIDQHDLMKQEIERQNEQLVRVSESAWGKTDWDKFQVEIEKQTLL